jgi:polar amino acid transport system substrate-binding protein
VKAAFSNRDVGAAMIAKLGLKNLRYAGKQSELRYYIGFSKEFAPKESVDAFNAAYRRLYKSGEIQKILKSYKMTPSAQE